MNTYKGKPCLIPPTIVKYRETEKINHMLGSAIASFIENHIEVGKDVKLFNISSRFEEVTIDDFYEYFGRYINNYCIEGKTYFIPDAAFLAFKEVFKKLIVDFKWVE